MPALSWRQEIESLVASAPGRVALTVEADGQAFLHRADEVFASASLIKVPILLAVLTAVRRGEADLAVRFPVPAEKVGGCGLVEFFSPDDQLSLHDLLLCMIAISDNAATNEVIDHFGMPMVNEYLRSLGLERTVLRRRMMDGAARLAGRENTTTPREMHSLMAEILRPRRVDGWVAATALGYLEKQLFPQGAAQFLPEGSVAHKTGELEGTFHDAGIILARGKCPVVYTYLSDGQPNLGESQVHAGRIGEILWSLANEALGGGTE